MVSEFAGGRSCLQASVSSALNCRYAGTMLVALITLVMLVMLVMRVGCVPSRLDILLDSLENPPRSSLVGEPIIRAWAMSAHSTHSAHHAPG